MLGENRVGSSVPPNFRGSTRSFQIAVDAETDGNENVQQEDQRGDQGNRGRGHHEVQTMHIRVPVVAILGSGPVPEEQSSHGHKQDECNQVPQSSRSPGCPVGKLQILKYIYV